jgi:hypothetical protein
MKRKFIIEEKLAQDILEYLASRPYREVFELIAALQRVEELPVVPLPVVEVDNGEGV